MVETSATGLQIKTSELTGIQFYFQIFVVIISGIFYLDAVQFSTNHEMSNVFLKQNVHQEYVIGWMTYLSSKPLKQLEFIYNVQILRCAK